MTDDNTLEDRYQHHLQAKRDDQAAYDLCFVDRNMDDQDRSCELCVDAFLGHQPAECKEDDCLRCIMHNCKRLSADCRRICNHNTEGTCFVAFTCRHYLYLLHEYCPTNNPAHRKLQRFFYQRLRQGNPSRLPEDHKMFC